MSNAKKTFYTSFPLGTGATYFNIKMVLGSTRLATVDLAENVQTVDQTGEKNGNITRTCGSHGGEYEDGPLLGFSHPSRVI